MNELLLLPFIEVQQGVVERIFRPVTASLSGWFVRKCRFKKKTVTGKKMNDFLPASRSAVGSLLHNDAAGSRGRTSSQMATKGTSQDVF